MRRTILAMLFLLPAIPIGDSEGYSFAAELMPDLSQWLPTPETTPGAATKLTAQQLCAKGFRTSKERPDEDYTETLKKKQLTQSRYHDKKPSDYEEDHLISLEIGGDPKDPHNLWPEPYAGKCGAHVKDKLEDKLHELVCAGHVSLAEAQHSIATDWIQAYRRYIGTLTCPQ